MRNWKPIFVENSRIPGILSKVAPISINAVTLGAIVFSKNEMDERTKRHETIHFQQFLETGFVVFILLYFWDYFWCYLRYENGEEAYRNIRAEREAYRNDGNEKYLEERVRWGWIFKKVLR